jgi:hypothetical protein
VKLAPAIYALAALLGALLRAPRLNVVVLRATVVHKRRRPWAWLLIGLARLRFKTLSVRAWHAQERLVNRAAYGDLPRVCAGWLVLPRRPGRVLAEHLTLRGFAAALRELRRLHTLPGLNFSHGDATIWNVTYDPLTDRAWWFDFETAHDRHRPPVWRRADDLRALVCSAAALLTPAELAAIGPLVCAVYEPPIVHAFVAVCVAIERWPDPAHCAQTRLSYPQWQRLLNYIKPLTAASAAS